MAINAEAIIEEAASAAESQPEAAPAVVEKPYEAEDFYKDDIKPANDAPGEEEGTEGQEEPEADLEPIAPPTSWAKEFKDQFAALPRDMQEIVSKRESERDKFVNQKSMEASQAQQRVESEARQAFAVLQRNHADQLQKYAQQFEAHQPDPRLLETGDPEHMRLYMQQQARYQSTAAQRSQAQQEADTARQQAEALQNHEAQLAIQEQHRVLAEQVPEWSEPSSRAKLLSDLQPIATELGYSDEVISQANASDILALRKIAEYKVDATKYRELMKKKMVPVRAAKGIPPAVRTGAPVNGSGQTMDATALLYPDDQPRRR